MAPPGPAVALSEQATPSAAATPEAVTLLDAKPLRTRQNKAQLRGLDDAGWLLELALSDLRQRLPGLLGADEISLQRLAGRSTRAVKLSLKPDFAAVLSPAGAGLKFVAHGARCALHAGPVRAACPLTEAASIRCLAALAWLARRADDPALGLVVEAVHGAAADKPVVLRLRSTAVGDRWTLVIDARHERLRAISVEIEGRMAELTLEDTPRRLSLRLDGRVGADWSILAPGRDEVGARKWLLLEAPIKALAGAEAAIGRLQTLATGLGGAATHPEAVVGHWQAGQLRLVAVQVAAILPIGATHPAIRALTDGEAKTQALQIRDGDLATGLRTGQVAEGCYRMIVLGPPEGSASAGQRDAIVALRPCAGDRGATP